MALVSITIPPAQLRELERVLNPKQLRRIQISTLAELKRTGKKIISDEVRTVMNIKAGPAKDAVVAEILKNGNPPSLTFTIAKKLPRLIDFTKTSAGKKGVTFQAMKSMPARHLPYSFKAFARSAKQAAQGTGHTGIFVRTKGYVQGPRASAAKRPYDRTRKFKAGPRGIAHRLPMREVRGPSIYELLMASGQFSTVGNKVLDRLRAKYIERLASKAEAMLAGKFR